MRSTRYAVVVAAVVVGLAGEAAPQAPPRPERPLLTAANHPAATAGVGLPAMADHLVWVRTILLRGDDGGRPHPLTRLACPALALLEQAIDEAASGRWTPGQYPEAHHLIINAITAAWITGRAR
ncbi:MAG TPA: hypothetical protein VM364_12870 [Vicinamibacterales bacterium]|nr:hypothetical protein [Vicinamibacterales bacterium]